MTHMAASGLASLGRNDDKMLVHMTPQEVGGLRHLAMAAGGDLTTNPHTGLPEAGFLSKLLPMIAGFALAPFTGGLSLFGSQALADAAIVAAGDTAITGSWKKGLMAGLGAYGGASLGTGIMGAGAPLDTSVANLDASIANTSKDIMIPDVIGPEGQALAGSGSGLVSNAVSAVANPSTLDSAAFAANPGGLSQFGTGLQNSFGSTSGLKSLWGGLNTPAKASLGITGLSALSDSGSSGIPSAAGGTTPFYNTTYDPTTRKFGPGTWSKNFTGRDYVGVPGAGQVANASGPLGSYMDPYTSMMEEGLVSARAGGAIKHMASGGDTSTTAKSSPSNLEAYAASLAAPNTASTPFTATAENTAANNAYMASLGAGTAPNLPPGAKDESSITGAYVPPPAPPAKPPTTGSGASGSGTGSSGAGSGYGIPGGVNWLACLRDRLSGTSNYTYDPTTGKFNTTTAGTASASGAGSSGSGYSIPGYGSIGCVDGSPTYSYDPITGKFTRSTTPGMNGGGGGGKAAGGGIGSLNTFAGGGTTLGSYSDGGRLLRGPGDGMSDSIPAHIHGDKPQPAALADGEFVVPADVVSHLGNGSTEAGSKQLYKMMDKVRRARTGNPKQGRQINPEQFIPA